jgi:hypothetical protein
MTAPAEACDIESRSRESTMARADGSSPSAGVAAVQPEPDPPSDATSCDPAEQLDGEAASDDGEFNDADPNSDADPPAAGESVELTGIESEERLLRECEPLIARFWLLVREEPCIERALRGQLLYSSQPITMTVAYLLAIPPRDRWTTCDTCSGTGKLASGRECFSCEGKGCDWPYPTS